MDNENIKEILEFDFQSQGERIEINEYERNILKDYITNLQEQLHQASLDIQELTEKDIGCPSWCDKLTNLQDTLKDREEYCYGLETQLTNLQEENERLKNRNDFLEKVCVGFDDKYEDYKSRNEKAKSLTNRTIEIIKQQPSGNDEWILERLNGINYCLGGDEEC